MELLGLLVVGALVVLPISALVVALGGRRRIDALELRLKGAEKENERLEQLLLALERELGPERPPVPVEKPAAEPAVVAAVAAVAAPAVAETAPLTLASPPIPDVFDLPSAAALSSPPPPLSPPSPPSPPSLRPPSPPAPLRPPEPPAKEKTPFDWESLVGVKLFSWLAGIFLVMGAVTFLGYSIQQGWLSPPIRMAIGLLTGVTLLVTCELKAARRYATTANALDGAAIAVLFSTFFAAHALWKVLPATGTFLALALVAVVAVALSIRRDSVFIALLGLLGGFATPALLSTGEDRPFALFGYLLLLSAGLTWVARRMRWPVLTGLAVVFTTIYQWVWVWRFLTAESLPVALGIFMVFPLLGFASLAFTKGTEKDDQAEPLFVRIASLAGLLPLAFAFFLAAVPAYGSRFELLFGFLFVLDAGLFAVALWRGPRLLHFAGAGSTLVVFGLWLGRSYVPDAWPTVLALLALFAIFFLAVPFLAESITGRAGRPTSSTSDDVLEDPFGAGTFSAPFLLFAFPALLLLEKRPESPGLLLFVLFVLDIAIGVAAFFLRKGELFAAALGVSGLTLLVLAGGAGRASWSRVSIGVALALVALGLGVLVAARRRAGKEAGGGTAPFAAAPCAAILLAQCVAIAAAAHRPSGTPLELLVAAHLALLLAAVGLSWWVGWHAFPLVAMVPAFVAASEWTAIDPTPTWSGRLLFAGVVYAVYLVSPLALGRRGEKLREPFLGAVLASVPFFFTARHCLTMLGHDGVIGLLPMAQAALLSLLLWWLLRLQQPEARDLGRLALVAGAVLAFVSVAIPLQLENEWVTLGWALEGAALAWLFTRIPHRGLLVTASALLAVVFVRLVFNPALLAYHPRSATPILNWYLYTYVVAAASFFGAAWFLQRTDDFLLDTGKRVSQFLPGLGTVLLFALVNLEVADFFATGPTVTFHMAGRSQAEDLTYTLAWAVFAILLLFAGVLFRSFPARIAAIGLLVVTILKAFFHDFAHLTGLSRVASFVGLAISLALVALAIQKFVLGKRGEGK